MPTASIYRKTLQSSNLQSKNFVQKHTPTLQGENYKQLQCGGDWIQYSRLKLGRVLSFNLNPQPQTTTLTPNSGLLVEQLSVYRFGDAGSKNVNMQDKSDSQTCGPDN